LVIPREIRRQAGLEAAATVDVTWSGSHIEIEPASLPVRLVRKGRFLVAVPEVPVDKLTQAEVEATREALLEERS